MYAGNEEIPFVRNEIRHINKMSGCDLYVCVSVFVEVKKRPNNKQEHTHTRAIRERIQKKHDEYLSTMQSNL